VDDKIKQLLEELGNAINESISASLEVNERIQKIRDEGYNLYVVLDATIGLDRDADDADEGESREVRNQLALQPSSGGAQFRINVDDLSFLRSVGIDPTRKVKVPKRLEGRTTGDND
jgi:hypothetical protein